MTNHQPTMRLVTLGCKVNQYETQLVQEALERGGFREAEADESADLCVVNTCTVTSEGDRKSRKTIRHLAAHNPGTKTIVMGCYATRDPEAVGKLPAVAEVVTDKRELPDVLWRFGIHEMPSGISRFEGHQRAFVKVQDGCILKCTYCIIPSVRPGLRSRPPEEIEEEVRRLVDNGHQEIVICGIHVGHYGVDTTRGKTGRAPFRLWHLLKQLDRIPGQWRMRLSSIEANEIDEDFMKAAADCEHLCPQFHPALQSGSDTVLKRMRRRYRIGRFLDQVQRFREMIPDVALTTDVIVGFPGESDEEFEETVETCRQAKFMKIHIFPFSPRKGTPAAEFPDQVPSETRKLRCEVLSSVERELAMHYYARYVEDSLEVLVERVCEDAPGWVRGTDARYIPVRMPGSVDDVGTIVVARGEHVHRDYLQAGR